MAILSGDPQEEIFGLMAMAKENEGSTVTTIWQSNLAVIFHQAEKRILIISQKC